MIDKWGLADWETPFVMLDGDRIIGMVTVAKTDYYPLPDVYPWVSGVFVSEEYRGHRLSGQMILIRTEDDADRWIVIWIVYLGGIVIQIHIELTDR